jgi:UDP-N-acetylglucosamine 2-epimerase (non-hydrolysing)
MLMKRCEMLLTDSGGIQEEATAPPIRKPVLVIRLSTERPEAVEAGFANVIGVEKENVLSAIENVSKMKGKLPRVSPYGDGKAAERIVQILAKEVL